jgi:uncharacterized membrane protein
VKSTEDPPVESTPRQESENREVFPEPIAEEIEEILGEEVAPEKRAAIKGLLVSYSRMHQGPLPDATTIAAYNTHIPNGGERVMAMAEKEQAHRMEMDKLVFKKSCNQSLRGQWMGFIISLLFVGAGTFLIHENHDVAGASIIGGSMVAIVALFLTGRWRAGEAKKREKDKKAE